MENCVHQSFSACAKIKDRATLFARADGVSDPACPRPAEMKSVRWFSLRGDWIRGFVARNHLRSGTELAGTARSTWSLEASRLGMNGVSGGLRLSARPAANMVRR